MFSTEDLSCFSCASHAVSDVYIGQRLKMLVRLFDGSLNHSESLLLIVIQPENLSQIVFPLQAKETQSDAVWRHISCL